MRLSALPAIICVLYPAVSPAATLTGEWTLEQTGRTDLVRVTLVRKGMIVGSTRLVHLKASAIEGLDLSALSSPGNMVTGMISRDAGTLRLEGTVREGGAEGTFRFVENPHYAAGLRGVVWSWWDTDGLLDLALSGVPLAFIENMRAQGVSGLTSAQLAQRYSGRDVPDWLSMAFDNPSTSTAVPRPFLPGSPRLTGGRRGFSLPNVRAYGISPDYSRALSRTGYTLFPQDMIRLHTHGVAPDLVRQMKLSGYDGLTVTDMIRLQSHGISSFDIHVLESRGKRNLTVDEIVKAKVDGVR